MEKLTKICTKCNCEKELELFTFSKKLNKYLTRCRKCTTIYKKEHYQKNKVEILEGMKAYRNDNKELMIKRKHEFYIRNKTTISEKAKVWRHNNKEKKAEIDKKYREANKDKLKVQAKAWKNANKDFVSKKAKEYNILNKDRRRELNKIYQNTEKGRIAKITSDNKRRFLKKQLSDNTIPLSNGHYPTSKVLLEMLKQQNHKCVYCECKISHKLKNIHLDHIVPISAGGTHSILNVQWLCASCNLSKGAKHPIDFAKEINVIPHDLEFML